MATRKSSNSALHRFRRHPERQNQKQRMTNEVESENRETKRYFAEPRYHRQGKTKGGCWIGHGGHFKQRDLIVGNAREGKPRKRETKFRTMFGVYQTKQETDA